MSNGPEEQPGGRAGAMWEAHRVRGAERESWDSRCTMQEGAQNSTTPEGAAARLVPLPECCSRLTGHGRSRSSCCFAVPGRVPYHSLQVYLGGSRPSFWVPAMYIGDPGRFPGSWLLPGPGLAV